MGRGFPLSSPPPQPYRVLLESSVWARESWVGLPSGKSLPGAGPPAQSSEGSGSIAGASIFSFPERPQLSHGAGRGGATEHAQQQAKRRGTPLNCPRRRSVGREMRRRRCRHVGCGGYEAKRLLFYLGWGGIFRGGEGRNGEAESVPENPRYEFFSGAEKEKAIREEGAILSVAPPTLEEALPGQGARGAELHAARELPISRKADGFCKLLFANLRARE